MAIIDISGNIRKGIWNYGDMYPDFKLISKSADVNKCFFEIFDGFNSQTGTYLETTAHINGYNKTRLIADVDVNELVDIPVRVLHVGKFLNGEKMITASMLSKASEGIDFPKGCAILLDSGWQDWYRQDFVSNATYLSLDAMQYLLSKEPSIMGSDTPTWQKTEDVFTTFAKTDILLLAPLVNLDKVCGKNAKLTVLPVKVEGTCCAPARAVIVE